LRSLSLPAWLDKLRRWVRRVKRSHQSAASARHEQDRVLRVLQHRGRDPAEIQRLAGRAPDPTTIRS